MIFYIKCQRSSQAIALLQKQISPSNDMEIFSTKHAVAAAIVRTCSVNREDNSPGVVPLGSDSEVQSLTGNLPHASLTPLGNSSRNTSTLT